MRKVMLRSFAAIAIVATASLGAASAFGGSASVSEETFQLTASTTSLPCMRINAQTTPSVLAQVSRGGTNDTLKLSLSGFKPDLRFDLFTVEKSSLNSNGTPLSGFKNFGMAWYQADIKIDSQGAASATLKTILFDRIFGFDAAAGVAPTNTFHLGLWFDNPAKATACGFTGSTPFNGAHNAGPLAFITVPNATTHLGPLCTDPQSSGSTFVCIP